MAKPRKSPFKPWTPLERTVETLYRRFVDAATANAAPPRIAVVRAIALLVQADLVLPPPTTCVGCGCTTDRACEGGCFWLRVNARTRLGFCSSCGARFRQRNKVDLGGPELRRLLAGGGGPRRIFE